MLKLDHIIVAVADLDASTARWEAMLGAPPVWRGSHPSAGTHNALFNFGDFYLELMAASGDGEHAQRVLGFIEKRGEGIMGVCLQSADIEATAQAWRAGGLEVAVADGTGTSGDKKREWKLAIAPLAQTQGLFIFAIEHLSGRLPQAQGAAGAAGAMHNLDHVVVMTSDPDRVKALIEKTFALPLKADREAKAIGVRQIIFGLGNKKFLEIASPLKGDGKGAGVGSGGSDASAGDASAGGETHFWGLAWRVRNLEAAHDRLGQKGFNLSEMRAGRQKGTRVFTIRNAPNALPTIIITGGD